MSLRKITRQQVRLGMFIHTFEGRWIDHPFWLPRFMLREPSDLELIRSSNVAAVVIDESRGICLDAYAGALCVSFVGPSPGEYVRSQPALGAERATSFTEERVRATKLVRHSTREMARLFAAVHAGEGLDIERFRPLVAEIMLSVSRNPYALIAITRLKKQDEYTYVHSIAVSTLMTSLARTLGMAEHDAFDIGLAGLLHDIGKMIVPDRILRKPGSLTDQEFALVRTHPEQGYLLLSQDQTIPPVILDVCRHHHERLDGSGYPFRLKDGAISLAARLAAICDVYDALTSNRSYKPAWKPEEAISRMYDTTGHFDRKLLVAFMRTIGVFPPGLLVRMRSNRLGVTMPNGRRASRAKIRVFFDLRQRALLPLEDVVAEDALSSDQVVGEEYPLDWGFTEWPLMAEQLLDGVVPQLRLPAHARL